MNTINDELLACYVEGTATPEEQILVRDYLTKNPEEYERVLYMMDLDREDYLGEMIEDNSNNIVPLNDSICTNITLSAAAFVPQKSMKTKGYITKRTQKPLKIRGLQDRLLDMLNTIDKQKLLQLVDQVYIMKAKKICAAAKMAAGVVTGYP